MGAIIMKLGYVCQSFPVKFAALAGGALRTIFFSVLVKSSQTCLAYTQALQSARIPRPPASSVHELVTGSLLKLQPSFGPRPKAGQTSRTTIAALSQPCDRMNAAPSLQPSSGWCSSSHLLRRAVLKTAQSWTSFDRFFTYHQTLPHPPFACCAYHTVTSWALGGSAADRSSETLLGTLAELNSMGLVIRRNISCHCFHCLEQLEGSNA